MKFSEHLRLTGQTAYAFFTKNELPKTAVYKVAQGKPVDYKSAKRISAATGGLVTIAEIME
jgi:predicted transcriptional regulator